MSSWFSIVADDPCRVTCDHFKQLERGSCVGSSKEIASFVPVSGGKHQISDEIKGDEVCVSVNSLNSYWYAENTKEMASLENSKRPFSNSCSEEVVSKRARQEEKRLSSESGERIITFEEKVRVNQVHLFSLCCGYYEDLYRPFPEFCHRRFVPIGPDHQANIPEYQSRDHSTTCVDSLHKIESPSSLSSVETRICSHGDDGCILSVREHVMRARRSLESSLGHAYFVALGFDDMGEVVARGWTEAEENKFREVVLSYPASSGRNFWPVLSQTFPSRSGKELVSYYFNVFVLRNRAEQNRSDPSNIDSDNDEWQGMSDDEENSLVESPAEWDEAAVGNVDVQGEFDDEDYSDEDGLYSVSDGCGEFGFCSRHLKKNSMDDDDDDYDDVQEGSCTSYESQFNSWQGDQAKHGLENDSSKLWETDYIGRIEKETEFLPTSHVIEELLGNKCLNEEEGRDGCHH